MEDRSLADDLAYDHRDGTTTLTKTLVWVGVAGVSAAIAFAIVRALITRQPVDPTSERIQHLIEEANRLLKTLDDQRTPD